MNDWTPVATALLAEVGLTFDDVYDLGRDWVRGPPGWEFSIGKALHRGICHYPSTDNPHARQRALIGITGPVDCELMLHILAHECGHVAQLRSLLMMSPSTPLYVREYDAEIYALDALRRHLGRDPAPSIVGGAKSHIRHICRERYKSLGVDPTKGWRRDIVEWCRFVPRRPLVFERA
jgi:hypothetical protein